MPTEGEIIKLEGTCETYSKALEASRLSLIVTRTIEEEAAIGGTSQRIVVDDTKVVPVTSPENEQRDDEAKFVPVTVISVSVVPVTGRMPEIVAVGASVSSAPMRACYETMRTHRVSLLPADRDNPST